MPSVQKLVLNHPGSMMSSESKEKSLQIIANPRNKCYNHLESDWFKQQLLPGERLNTLQTTYMNHLRKSLDIDSFSDDFLVSPPIGSDQKTSSISLGKLTHYTLLTSGLWTFFGDEL